MNAFFDFYVENPTVTQYAIKTIHHMFNDCEFLNDECIIQWHEKKLKEDKLSDEEKNLLKKMEPFIEWLKEDEDEEDDE
jgi:hypothetical protein